MGRVISTPRFYAYMQISFALFHFFVVVGYVTEMRFSSSLYSNDSGFFVCLLVSGFPFPHVKRTGSPHILKLTADSFLVLDSLSLRELGALALT
jgi:hypothetical protein